jgi:HlyD family secretion protein
MTPSISISPQDDLRRHSRMGLMLSAGFVALVFGWGAIAKVSGAVVAPGRVAVESSVKRVQHKEGGIVSQLLVRDGDQVKAGQLLARLDGTVPGANLSIIDNQLEEFLARRQRLRAERDQLGVIPTDAGDLPHNDSFTRAMAVETRTLAARRALQTQRKAGLRDQINQAGLEADGLRAQIESGAAQHKLIDGELQGMRQLYAKGLAPLARVSQLERESRRLEGEGGQLKAEVAKARSKMAELRTQTYQLDSEYLAEVMNDLKDTDLKIAQLSGQQVAGADELRRVEVRAPASGQVQQLAFHTVGGVVAPGDTILVIVPTRDDLVVEAKIAPQSIDEVRPGQAARVRLTAFGAPNTPVLNARIDSLSSDIQTDERSGATYYVARLKISQADLPRDVRSRMVAGMPAEVQIGTSSRTALSYATKPIVDQLARSFREQ